MITRQNIENNVNLWVATYLPNFKFRPYQFEYICSTLYSLFNETSLNIIEAPTGSGKSIMVMIMAGVLDKFYKLRSYILCSDLYLWQQYADAIDKYGLYFGKIKGSTGNYICPQTGEDLSAAPCRLANIGWSKLFDENFCLSNGWVCALDCEYIQERKKAVSSPVTLMTYQLYFPCVNEDKDTPFKNRDVVFCDECHNVPNLCQQYSTITMDMNKNLANFRILLNFAIEKKYAYVSDLDLEDFMLETEKKYKTIFDIPYTNQDELYEHLYELLNTNMKYLFGLNQFLLQEYQKKRHMKRLTKKEYQALNIGGWIDKFCCEMKKYLDRVNETKTDYIVKTDNKIQDPNNWKKTIWPENPVMCYKFAKEDYLVDACLLKNQSTGTIFLSATVGDHMSYDDNIGTHMKPNRESNMLVMPSTFDFSKSPIYFIPGNKMSRDYINDSIKKNANIINAILTSPKHIKEKGIIHTGSYKIMNDTINLLSPEARKRIFMYTTAKEKDGVLEDFEMSTNGVLIGPTLMEGIDLPDDGCRFIIFLKIPYPYLGDNLVKTKCVLFPRWYNSQTSNNVIQGIGRGNRTPTDWSTTYILDGSFSTLYQQTRAQYPKELQERLRVITNNN